MFCFVVSLAELLFACLVLFIWLVFASWMVLFLSSFVRLFARRENRETRVGSVLRCVHCFGPFG